LKKRIAFNENKQYKNKKKINKIVSDIYEEDNVSDDIKNIENKLKDIVNDNDNSIPDNTTDIEINDNDNINNTNIPKVRSNRRIKNNI
jgi:hypothetical protein